jgi:hypothetical protein
MGEDRQYKSSCFPIQLIQNIVQLRSLLNDDYEIIA